MKTIEITVSSSGEAVVETRGYAGRDCLEASRLFEQGLGAKTSDRLTADFYRQAQAEPPLRQQS